jgi:hypothetical protein
MPKIDLEEMKKSKKKKPWASMDELLAHGKTGNEKSEKSSTAVVENKVIPPDEVQKILCNKENRLTEDAVFSPANSNVNLERDLTEKIDSKATISENTDISNSKLIEQPFLEPQVKFETKTPILNAQNVPYKADSTSSIDSSTKSENKTSIENIDRIYTESIDNLYRDNNSSIQNLYRNSIEKQQKQSVDTGVYIDSVNKSIYKSIQMKSTEPLHELPINFQNNTLSTILKVGSKQFVILLYLFKTTAETGTHSTKEISAGEISQVAKTSIGSARSAINELIEKKLVTRKIFSKAGWTVYEFSDQSYQLVLKYTQNITDPNLYRFYTEMTIQNYIDLAPSKLVSNINTNLLTKEDLPEVQTAVLPTFDVTAIDLHQVNNFRITRKQIQDIYNQRLNFTTTTLQEFVDRFAIYASDSSNIKNVNNIPALFVRMAQLASKGQDPLIDIETDTDRAIRQRIERLKAIKEDRMKQENELLGLEYENWFINLTLDQMNEIAPPTTALKAGSSTQKILIKNYFAENIWPQIRTKIFSESGNYQV